jgi:hypothetical protein
MMEQTDAFTNRHDAGAPFRPELTKLGDKVAGLIAFGVPGLRHGFFSVPSPSTMRGRNVSTRWRRSMPSKPSSEI